MLIISTLIFFTGKMNKEKNFFVKKKKKKKNRSSVIKKIFLIHGKFQYSPDIQMGNKIHMEIPL